MDRMAEQVLAKLIELQGDRTDADFGADIDLSPTHWRHIKAMRRRLTYSIIQRAVRKYPSLYPVVVSDLAGDQKPDVSVPA
jgi:hypothetical protein